MLTKTNFQYFQDQIKQFATDKMVIVDATCGNGNDTLFLATTFSDAQIYAFDIQPQAIAAASQKCQQCSNINFILDSHEYIGKYVPDNISLAVFNLGYLPGGDSNLTTTGTSTIKAIEEILIRLNVGGAICIMLYNGEENKAETQMVYEYIQNLNKYQYIASSYQLINLKNAPFSVIIEKK